MLLLVLAPSRALMGQSIDSLISIKPAVAAAPTCVPDRSQLLDRPRRGLVGPSPIKLIIPPLENMPTIRNPVTLRMHVTALGVVDSVVVIGITDSAYASRVRQSSMGMRFRQATRDGCLVAEWYEATLNFPQRR